MRTQHWEQLLATPVAIPQPDWWEKAEDDPSVQLYANYGIAAAYGAVGLIALVQLIRIHLRVPEYGWTTQKVFHLLNFLVCAMRVGIFALRNQLEAMHPAFWKLLVLDFPGLLFFTTYTLLVLFWAEIYHQARSMPISSLRPKYIVLNLIVYAIQIKLWFVSSMSEESSTRKLGYLLSDIFLAVVSVTAALGFLLYGGRLIIMLQRFPIESRGRRKKLWEVGLVTSICAGCFSTRAVLIALSAADREDLEIDLMDHPLLNVGYYFLVEILPTAAVLYILRKLPPKRQPQQQQGYQQIPTQ